MENKIKFNVMILLIEFKKWKINVGIIIIYKEIFLRKILSAVLKKILISLYITEINEMVVIGV